MPDRKDDDDDDDELAPEDTETSGHWRTKELSEMVVVKIRNLLEELMGKIGLK